MAKWSSERSDELVRLFCDGYSMTAIANEISRQGFPCTRSAVAGQLKRMREKNVVLESRPTRQKGSQRVVAVAQQPPVLPAAQVKPAEPPKPAAKVVAPEQPAPAEAGQAWLKTWPKPMTPTAVIIYLLKDRMCRMPLWAEDTGRNVDRQFYCAAPTDEGRSYCSGCFPRTKGTGTPGERSAVRMLKRELLK